MEHAVEGMTRRFGNGHIRAALAVVELAVVLIPQNEPARNAAQSFYVAPRSGGSPSGIAQTVALLENLYKRLRASVGAPHQVTIRAMRVYGHAKMAQGEYAEAGNLLRRALHSAEETLGRDHPDTVGIVAMLGLVHKQQDESNIMSSGDVVRMAMLGDGGGASTSMRPWFQRYLAWREARIGLGNHGTRLVLQLLASSFVAEKNYHEASGLFDKPVRSFQQEGISSPAADEASQWLQICRMSTSFSPYRLGGGGGSSDNDVNSLLTRFGFLRR